MRLRTNYRENSSKLISQLVPHDYSLRLVYWEQREPINSKESEIKIYYSKRLPRDSILLSSFGFNFVASVWLRIERTGQSQRIADKNVFLKEFS